MIVLSLVLLLCAAALGAKEEGKLPKLVAGTKDDGVMEGDMMMPEGSGGSDRNMINGDRLRWPKNSQGIVEVPYVFASSFGTKARKYAKMVFTDYERWTCVKFVPRSSQKNYVNMMSKGQGVCWSMVGMVGGKQDLSLGPSCEWNKGTPTHEMMHALGFYHEQNRPDRDNYIRVMYDNIDRRNRNAFDKCTDCSLPRDKYDINSVMHYDKSFMALDWNKPTMVALNGKEIGQRGGMDELDIRKINEMYKCNGKTSQSNAGVTIPAEEPYDQWTNCPELARQGCDSIKEKCPYSCGVTGGGSTGGGNTGGGGDGECKDSNSGCPDWAKRGECRNNPGWMKSNCKKSCNVCSGGGGNTGGGGSNKKDEYGTSWCSNYTNRCSESWFKQNCAKTCNA